MAWFKEVKEFFIVQYWRNIAYQIACEQKTYMDDCKTNCVKLSKKMDTYHLEYDICHGFYQKVPHRWVEIYGKTVDPSIAHPNYHLYTERIP